jgi:hypothetical protein
VTIFGHGMRGLKYHIALTSLYGMEESITANAFLGAKVSQSVSAEADWVCDHPMFCAINVPTIISHNNTQHANNTTSPPFGAAAGALPPPTAPPLVPVAPPPRPRQEQRAQQRQRRRRRPRAAGVTGGRRYWCTCLPRE